VPDCTVFALVSADHHRIVTEVLMHMIQTTGLPVFVRTAYVRTHYRKRQLERAMREADLGSVTRQVHAGEEAIFLRWQQMENNRAPGDVEGRETIRSATNDLLRIIL
jgi:hypothetical protein